MKLSVYWESVFHSLYARQGGQFAKTRLKQMYALF